MNDQRKEFLDLLYEKNQQINLVSRRIDRLSLESHWDDVKEGSRFLRGKSNCLDLGSGGGFPGLVLAILHQEVEFTLLEAEAKKCRWLREASSKLGLQNVSVVWGRAEEVGHDVQYREKFDVVTARAVAELRVLLEFAMPFLKIGGTMLAWKGPSYAEEIESAQRALNVLKGKLIDSHEYEINGEKRIILLFEKRDAIEDVYPRSVGVPKKRPL